MDFITTDKTNVLSSRILKDFPPQINIVEVTDANVLSIVAESLNLYVDKSLDQDQYSHIILTATLNNGKWITLDGNNYVTSPMQFSF